MTEKYDNWIVVFSAILSGLLSWFLIELKKPNPFGLIDYLLGLFI